MKIEQLKVTSRKQSKSKQNPKETKMLNEIIKQV